MSNSEQTEQTPIRLKFNNDSNFKGRFGGSEELVVRSLEELRAELEAIEDHEQQKAKDVAGFLIGKERKEESQVKDHHQSLNIPEAGQKTSIAVSIVIENANRNDTSECEHGYKADREYIRKVAEKLGCTDNLEYKPGDRSKQELLKFIREKCPLHVARVFLFISSHGNRNGFSTGTEHVRLRELLEPLSRAADEVLTFYHACRGTKEHFVKQEDPALDSGDDGDGEGGDGASLPLKLRLNCSVIYSSQSGYVSRWQEKDGSRLLRAVRLY
uniref:CASPASE_P20 domain-containing protein n=1 Tax=Macrostomum lignano TaxID=282301 RepID=A0A1I8I1X5_9PLAT